MLPVDIVLLDYRLPDMDGFEVLAGLKEIPGLGAVPVVLVTADDSPEVITGGLDLGVNDFVLKPFEPIELVSRIRIARQVKRERDELRRRNEQLERAASLDVLTGIPNRAHLDRQLVRLSSQARRRRHSLAVLAVDIDLFKHVNDTHGHAAGDHVLRMVAEVLTQSVRAEDVVGRVGGDEFLVLLPEADDDGAAELAERLRRRIRSATVRVGDVVIPISVSIGCAAGVVVGPDELVQSADNALYLAKANGRDCVVVASARVRDKRGAITVLIVDDHRMVAEGMARLVEREDDLLVMGVVTTSTEAVDTTRVSAPDVILLDYHLPDVDGVSTARLLRGMAPDVRVVLITGDGSDEVLLNAIDAGCAGYIDKTRASDELVAAVRHAHAGEIVMAPAEMKRLLPRLPRFESPREVFLTDTEREILTLASEGLDNGRIAEVLGLRAVEVQRDVRSLQARLDARSKLETIAAAHRSGLIASRPA
jgi:diguanylate cyclase (GGDEF)-like protein